MKFNYKSDFDFVLRLKDSRDEDSPWPSYDWSAVFWTSSKANVYTAYFQNGVYHNCFRTEDGDIHFVFDNHHLGKGTLKWEPHFELPNDIYPDDIQDLYRNTELDIELVDGNGDDVTTAEVEAMLPYIRIKWDDLTEEEKAELSKPAIDAAATLAELEQAIEQAEATRSDAEDIRQANETKRQTAESERLTNEENRIKAEAQRVEEFAGFASAVNSKQDALINSDEIVLNTDNSLSLTDKSKYSAFDEQWQAIGGTVIASGEEYEINDGKGDFTDAVKAMSYYNERPLKDVSYLCFGKTLKLLPTIIVANTTANFSSAFQSFNGVEKVSLKSTLDGGPVRAGSVGQMFNSSGVRELDCMLDLSSAENVAIMFNYCSEIREVRLSNLKSNIHFMYAKNISLESLQYLIANASNTSAITITVHPDTYAKLTGDTTNAAAAALTPEELAQWQQVVADANTRDISIATT